MRPCELSELKTVMAFLERANKEDKTCNGVSLAFRLQIQLSGGVGWLQRRRTNDIEHEADEAVVCCER